MQNNTSYKKLYLCVIIIKKIPKGRPIGDKGKKKINFLGEGEKYSELKEWDY